MNPDTYYRRNGFSNSDQIRTDERSRHSRLKRIRRSAHAQPDHIIVLTSFTNDEHNLSKPFYLHFAEIMQIIRIFV